MTLTPPVKVRSFRLGKTGRRYATALMFIAAMAAGAAIHAYGPDLHPDFPKLRITKAGIHDLAFNAFPGWAKANPDRTCPTSLDELRPWTKRDSSHDGWGGRYHFSCAKYAGEWRIGVWSLGEDEIFGTPDDVRNEG